MCVSVEPESAKAVLHDVEWEEIKLAADGVATDTIILPGDLPSIELREGALYKRGVEYGMANGSCCPTSARNSLWDSLQREKHSQLWRRLLM